MKHNKIVKLLWGLQETTIRLLVLAEIEHDKRGQKDLNKRLKLIGEAIEKYNK